MSFRLTALEVATTVAVIGLGGFHTGVYFNARDTWWKRAQWAIDKGVSDDDLDRQVGLAAMTVLLDSRLATRRDAALLGAAVRLIADDALDQALAEPAGAGGPGDLDSGPRLPDDGLDTDPGRAPGDPGEAP